MLIACLKCGTPVSVRWLFLGLPWGSYECPKCGARFAGTVLRFVLTSLAVGVVGYVLIAVVKGRMAPAALALPVCVALALLLLRFPGQIKSVK